MSAPIFTSRRARSWTCGSHAALPMTVSPRRQRRGHEDVLGGHHRRLVHEDLPGAQAADGRVDDDVPLVRGSRAERGEAVEVRVQATAPDHVAAGRRHHRAAEPRQERAGEQERRADGLRAARVDLAVRIDVGGAQADLVARRARSTSTPRPSRTASIASTSRIRGTLRDDDLLAREHACGEDRQGAVLVPGGHDRTAQGRAALDDELLHSGGRRGRLARALG